MPSPENLGVNKALWSGIMKITIGFPLRPAISDGRAHVRGGVGGLTKSLGLWIAEVVE